MPADEKTESATPKKRNELRRRGQVPKSPDLSSIVVLVGLVVVIHILGGSAASHLQNYMKRSLADMSNTSLTPHVLFTKSVEMGTLLLQVVGPFVLTAFLLGVIVNLLQTGFLLSTQALVPDFNRINPLNGVKRFISSRGLVEVVKSLGKLGIIGWIGYSTVSNGYAEILATTRREPLYVTSQIGDMIYRLSLRISLFLLVLASLDYIYQRWSFEKSIRMTKEEVRQDMKQTEGNPQMKQRIRARQRMMAKRRMMDSVPLADVVLTNPTHFAVALKYDGASMVAPLLVAKGADLVAQRIRELAEEHNVPIVENPPLTRALFRQVDIGQEVPGEFYGAVAEVLAFVYQINKKRGFARA